MFNRPLSEIVSEQDPVAVQAGTPLSEVVDTLRSKRIGSVVVLDGDRPFGIFTERDLLLKVVGRDIDLASTPVRQFMSPKVITLRLSDSVGRAIAAMRGGNFRHLPLMGDDGKIVKVLSQKDIINYLADSFELSAT